MNEPLQLRRLLERLVEAEVAFVLVGGLAVNAWGYLRGTRDLDIVPDPARENLDRLSELLQGLGGKVEVGDRRLEGSAIPTFLRTGDRTSVATDWGSVDVLQGLPQVPRFESLIENAIEVDLDGIAVRVCSLDDLVAMKRSSQRARDRDDLEALQAAREDDGTEG